MLDSDLSFIRIIPFASVESLQIYAGTPKIIVSSSEDLEAGILMLFLVSS